VELPEGYLTGRVSQELLTKLDFPAPGEETLFATCGPKAFNAAIKETLLANGYSADHFVTF